MEVPNPERMHAKRSIEEDIESCSAHLQSLQIAMEDLADELAALTQGSRSDGPGRAIRDLRMSLDGASDALFCLRRAEEEMAGLDCSGSADGDDPDD